MDRILLVTTIGEIAGWIWLVLSLITGSGWILTPIALIICCYGAAFGRIMELREEKAKKGLDKKD